MRLQWSLRARPDRGAELSAACGRYSEAKHGQSKEKASVSVDFDYALPLGEAGAKNPSLCAAAHTRILFLAQ